MRSCLKIGDYDKSCSKLIEIADLIRREGFEISQVWQSEEDYETVGVNFCNENGYENMFLIRDGKELSLEFENGEDKDIRTLINLYNLIKVYESENMYLVEGEDYGNN